MSRAVKVTVTAADLAGRRTEYAVVSRAIEWAIPGAVVESLDPVHIEFLVRDPDHGCDVRWQCPTPEPAARHLYHVTGDDGPYSFELRVPDCLAAFLCHGPEPTDAA